VDAFVPRVQPEPVVANARGLLRPQKRQRRDGDQSGADEPQFPLEPRPEESHAAHSQPRSPSEDGLGRNLDVTA
jgi:hypothetical protein